MSTLSLQEMLSAIFTGDLADIGRKLTLEDPEGRAIPARDLLTPDGMAPVMARFAADRAGGDPRAIASVWYKHYVAALLLPVAAITLIFGQDLPLALDGIKVEIAENGGIAAIILPHAGEPLATDDPYRRFTPLIRGNLAPVVELLAKTYRVSPKVLWSNAGTSLELVFRQIGARVTGAGAIEQAILGAKVWPDGWPNPLYQPVRYLPVEGGRPRRERRVCCIRYLIPNTPYCATCPLPQAKSGSAS